MVVVEVKLLQGKVLNVNVPSIESTVRDVADKVKELMGIVDTDEGNIEQEVKLIFNGKSLTIPSSSLQASSSSFVYRMSLTDSDPEANANFMRTPNTIGYDPADHANMIVAIILKRKRKTLVHAPVQSKKQTLAEISEAGLISDKRDHEHQEVEAKVCQLTEMGFPEDIVRHTLKLTNNNSEASLNYLCNNISGADLTPISLNSMESSGEGGSIGCIPVESGQTNHPELSTRPGSVNELKHHLVKLLNSNKDQRKESSSDSVGGDSRDNVDALNFFRHHPQFEQIRSLVRSSPSNLESFLKELGNQSPDLLLRINNDPEAFLYILTSERDTGTETLDVENRKFEAEAMAMVEDLISKGSKIESAPLIVAEGDKGDRVAEPSDMKEKVDYIASIVPDISRQRITEALVSCDMNEEHALNMLLDNI